MPALVDKTTPTVRSGPDIGKLNGMAGPIVQVTRYTARNQVGHTILPPTKMTVDGIIKLISDIPAKHGSGMYHFKVHEEGGTDEDSWTTKLGSDIEMPESNGVNGSANGASSGEYLGEQIAPGWWYVRSLNSVINPQGKMVPWHTSPFATGAPPAPGVAPVAPVTPQATEIPMHLQFPSRSMSGFGDSSQREIESLKETIRQQEARARDESYMKAMTDLRDSFTKVVGDLAQKTDAKFEALLNKITDKPSGPSETERLMAAQIEEMRRQQADTAKEAAMRAEFKSMIDAIASKLESNKSDPALMMLTQVMTKAMESSSATTQAIQSAAQAHAQSAERSALMMVDRLGGSIVSPAQMIELMKNSKDDTQSANAHRQLFGMFNDLFGMAKNLVREHAEIASAGSGPAWMPLAEQGVQTVGRLATILASKQSQPAQQPPMRIPVPQMQPGQPQPRPVAPAAPQRPLTPQEQSDEAARRVFGDAALRGEAPATAQPPTQVPFPPAPTPTPAAAPVQAEQPAATAAPVPAPAVVPAQAAAPVPLPPPSAVVVPDAVIAPASTPQDQFVSATPEAMRAAVSQISDEEFFGLLYPDVVQTREKIEDLTPEEIANGVYSAYQHITTANMTVPCLDVLVAGHIELVVERMLPEVEEESLAMIGAAIRAKFS